MLKLSAKIEITGESSTPSLGSAKKKWVFDKITACKIERDSDALTTTCKLTLPRKVKWQGETSNPIKRGDKISVWLGYDDNLQLAFSGYVLRVSLKAPIVIECEDEMFSLKNQVMDYSIIKSDMSMLDVLKKLTSFPVRSHDFNIGYYFRSSAQTAAQFLDYIKSFGVDKFFFREIKGKINLVCVDSLVSGLKNDEADTYIFASGINIIKDDKLMEFNPCENDIYIRIYVPASVNGNRKIIERGTNDKALKRFIIRNQPLSEEYANRIADFLVKRESVSGLKGSFTTFGNNLLWPFDIAAIKIDGKRAGKYYVLKNTITFGSSGFRQNITLGARVAD